MASDNFLEMQENEVHVHVQHTDQSMFESAIVGYTWDTPGD